MRVIVVREIVQIIDRRRVKLNVRRVHFLNLIVVLFLVRVGVLFNHVGILQLEFFEKLRVDLGKNLVAVFEPEEVVKHALQVLLEDRLLKLVDEVRLDAGELLLLFFLVRLLQLEDFVRDWG